MKMSGENISNKRKLQNQFNDMKKFQDEFKE